MSDGLYPTSLVGASNSLFTGDLLVYDPLAIAPFIDENKGQGIKLNTILRLVRQRLASDYAANKLFYGGDHWQAGNGWAGRLPEPSDRDAVRVLQMIRKGFVSKNCVKEVTNRKVDGAIGLEPTWSYVPRRTVADGDTFSAQEQSLIAEAEAGMTAWWDDREAHLRMRSAFVEACLGGASTLRIFIPSGLLNGMNEIVLDNGANTALGERVVSRIAELKSEAQRTQQALGEPATGETVPLRQPAEIVVDEQNLLRLAAALDHIYVEAIAPTNATIATDPNTMQKVGMYYNKSGKTTRGEITYLIGRGQDAFTVVQNLVGGKGGRGDANGARTAILQRTGIVDTTTSTGSESRTRAQFPTPIMRAPNNGPIPVSVRGDEYNIVAEAALPNPEVDSEMWMELGGQLTMFEIEIPQLITDQVRTLQKAINQAYTMATSNIQLAGFLERTVLNGQLPGHFEPVADQPGKERFVRDEMMIGGGAVNFINGIPQYDKDKNFIGVTDPAIVYKDPVDPKSFSDTITMHYTGLLQEVQQVHYLLAGEQYASGESRKQARADFEDSLRQMKAVSQKCGRWLMETVLNMAAWIMDEPERYRELRCVFTTRVNPGPATTESIRSAIELFNGGLKSRNGAMTMAGEEDSVAEARQIDTDRENGIVPLSLLTAQMNIDAQAEQAQLDADAAASDNGNTNGSANKAGGSAKSTGNLARQNNSDAATQREAKNGARPRNAARQSNSRT